MSGQSMRFKCRLQLIERSVPLAPAAAIQVEPFFIWLDAEFDTAVSDVLILHSQCTSTGALAFAAPGRFAQWIINNGQLIILYS